MENCKNKYSITPEMILLDIVEKHASTKEVFKKYDVAAGECILCHNLFEPLKNVISRYNLNSEKLLSDLNSLK
jgi:predicted secreted protein